MAAIILAAGAATRMGRLKQLLSFDGQTFINRAISTARQANFSPVIVVVGAEAESVQAAVASQRVSIVQNTHWREGMGSSISAGIRHLQQEQTDAAAVAILLADQPLINAEHLDRMRTEFHRSGAAIVAAQYSSTLGVPAIFQRGLWGTLATLPPDSGARRLFADPSLKIQAFPLPQAATDIDTPEDLAALQSREAS